MREIKFRAWHKENEVMFDVADYMPPAKPAFVGSVADDDLNDFALPECELMQYTGLKDSEGVEVFEGDVLQGEWGKQTSDIKSPIIGPVAFSNGCFIWDTWLKQFTGFDDSRSTGVRWVEEFPYHREYREVINIKIIGNIKQNPELLK